MPKFNNSEKTNTAPSAGESIKRSHREPIHVSTYCAPFYIPPLSRISIKDPATRHEAVIFLTTSKVYFPISKGLRDCNWDGFVSGRVRVVVTRQRNLLLNTPGSHITSCHSFPWSPPERHLAIFFYSTFKDPSEGDDQNRLVSQHRQHPLSPVLQDGPCWAYKPMIHSARYTAR